jgi:2,3-bisphosphoglycerate-independent phosphoglycerate mutase
VPFVLWGTDAEPDAMVAYGEKPAEQGSMQVGHGHLLMQYLMAND